LPHSPEKRRISAARKHDLTAKFYRHCQPGRTRSGRSSSQILSANFLAGAGSPLTGN